MNDSMWELRQAVREASEWLADGDPEEAARWLMEASDVALTVSGVVRGVRDETGAVVVEPVEGWAEMAAYSDQLDRAARALSAGVTVEVVWPEAFTADLEAETREMDAHDVC